MNVEELSKLSINAFLNRAAEVLDEILVGIPEAKQEPEWAAMRLALRARSKDIFAGADALAARKVPDPRG